MTSIAERLRHLEGESLRVVGLMSGTSGDGIDAARVELREAPAGRPQVVSIHGQTEVFSDELSERLIRDLASIVDVETAARWDAELGELFAESAAHLIARVGGADVVALSGHTFAHLPGETPRTTLQLGNPAVVAERLRLPVVAGFRSVDVARGGEGAPLVPAGDRVLFGEPGENIAVINVGGIANITWLPADGGDPHARDTGPGNLVLNHLVRRATDGAVRWDDGGRLASSGQPQRALADRWLDHPFFARGAPRSTGREEFGERWVVQNGELSRFPLPDQLATVVVWIANTIARGLRRLSGPTTPDRILIAGGGVAHGPLREELARVLPRPPEPLDEASHRVGSDLREAAAFAVLGYEFLHGRPGSFPTTTGCRYSGPLGALYLPAQT